MVFPCPLLMPMKTVCRCMFFFTLFFFVFCISFFSIDSFLRKLKLVSSVSRRLKRDIILEGRKIKDFTCSRKTNLKIIILQLRRID